MPYPNEHACRLNPPGKYKSFARQKRKSSNGKIYSVIFGIFFKNGKKTSEEQAYRYPKETWNANEARRHCQDHDGSFEAASKEMIENPLIPAWDEWDEGETNGKEKE